MSSKLYQASFVTYSNWGKRHLQTTHQPICNAILKGYKKIRQNKRNYSSFFTSISLTKVKVATPLTVKMQNLGVFATSALFLALTVVAYPTVEKKGTVAAGTSTSGKGTKGKG